MPGHRVFLHPAKMPALSGVEGYRDEREIVALWVIHAAKLAVAASSRYDSALRNHSGSVVFRSKAASSLAPLGELCCPIPVFTIS
ncbi:MAG: hypothetical protein ACLFR1_14765, partial [Spirochaetia bacterium]